MKTAIRVPSASFGGCLIEQTCYPGAAVLGDTLYCLGGEGGPRLYHPATLQIGKIVGVTPQ